jgi:hypothetical protein
MTATTIVLRGGGSALVLAKDGGGGLPHVLHWGADIPDAVASDLALLTGAPVALNQLDAPWQLSVLPTSGEGWLGTPAYAAHRDGGSTAPRWVATLEGGENSATVRSCCAPGSPSTGGSSSTPS